MTGQRMLAVVPMEMLPPFALLKQQTNLITGEISDGERFIVAFGPDNPPAIYVHLSDAILKFPLPMLVENGYKALAALHLDDAWTPFEREPASDPPGGGEFYINSIYEVVVSIDEATDTRIVTYARADRQPIVHPAHWRRIIDELIGEEWTGIHSLASATDTQFQLVCARTTILESAINELVEDDDA